MAEHTPRIEPALRPSGSFAPEYFDELYDLRADPWDFATSSYEAEKYAASLAALPRAQYGCALELGCSIGVLTARLATRCRSLVATDISQKALAQARQSCAAHPHVSFLYHDVCSELPGGAFDLIVMSEIGYYLSLPDLEALRLRIRRALTAGGHLLLVHYRGETNYPLTAEQVHGAFLQWPDRPWEPIHRVVTPGYRLDLLTTFN